MRRNPYDRRRDPLDRAARGWDGFQSFGPVRRESLITVGDLEAMVHSAMSRGQQQAAEEHNEALRQARREAWDDGNAVGQEEGRDAALLDFERLHGALLRTVQDEALVTLQALEQDPRKVAKHELAARLDQAHALLLTLLHSLELGFREHEPDREA